MASPALRCLSRPSTTLPTRIAAAAPLLSLSASTAAPFSTTAAAAAAPGKGGPPAKKSDEGGRGRHFIKGKGKKNYRKTGFTPKNVKRPEPGARKAFRKRVELTNNNALPVNADEMAAGSMTDTHLVNRVLALPDNVVDQLRAVEAFRPSQSWGMFRRPHFLIRKETLELGVAMEEAREKKEALRMVVTGDKVAGKSLMLLQAMAHGFMNKWVVIHIPEAHQLTNAHTDYSPIPDTDPVRFTQPTYTQALLQRIIKANGDVLKAIPCSRDYTNIPFMAGLPPNPTLRDLAASVRESEFAWPVFLALWTELTRVPGRPPVVLSLDGMPHVMKNSAYRDPQYRVVHAFELTLVRTFVQAMAGETALVNGGAILAASGGNDNLSIPSVDLALSQIEAGQAGKEIPMPDPFEKGYDDRVYDVLKDTRIMRVGGLSKIEARSLMEYWARSGMFLHKITEAVVSSKWTLGGQGIVGEMEKAALKRVRF